MGIDKDWIAEARVALVCQYALFHVYGSYGWVSISWQNGVADFIYLTYIYSLMSFLIFFYGRRETCLRATSKEGDSQTHFIFRQAPEGLWNTEQVTSEINDHLNIPIDLKKLERLNYVVYIFQRFNKRWFMDPLDVSWSLILVTLQIRAASSYLPRALPPWEKAYN